MKTISLTKGFSATVDDGDYERLSQWKWCVSIHDGRAYAFRGFGGRGGRGIYMHREINGTPGGMVTDHIDGDTLNNQRRNLRTATTSQNSMNTRSHRDSVSKYKGGGPNSKPPLKIPKPWVAQIMIDGRQTYIGQFATEEEAAAAYEAKARMAYGEFFPVNAGVRK